MLLPCYLNKCCPLEQNVTMPIDCFSPVSDKNFGGQILAVSYMMMVAVLVDYVLIVVVAVDCELILSGVQLTIL